MKLNTRVFLIIFSVVLNIIFIVGYAATLLEPEFGDSKQSVNEHKYIYTELNLSRQQIERIEPLRDRFHDKLDSLSQKIQEKRLQYVDLLAAEQPDLDAIQNERREIIALQGELQETTTEHLLEMRTIFTLEQRQQFFSLFKSRLESENEPVYKSEHD